MRGTARPQPELRRRPARPPSRSRTRTGGAAGAVLLIVLGTGTLGAIPAVPAAHVHGRATNAAESGPSGSPAGPSGTDLGDEVLGGVGVGPPALAADQTLLEERPAQFTTALPDQRAQVAIATATAQLGLPYVWGGDGPRNGDAGFDCSGLTTFSYAAAGVGLPRTAHTQYYTGPHVPRGAALQPGDLIFYGTPARVHHVGLYLGDGKMVNAPTFGKLVQVAFYRWGGDDYLGATRPAATGTTTGLLPYAPPAPSAGAPQEFPAPVAPAPTIVPVATAAQPAPSVSAAEAVSVQTTSGTAAVTPTATVTPTTVKPVTTHSSVVATATSTERVTTTATTTSSAVASTSKTSSNTMTRTTTVTPTTSKPTAVETSAPATSQTPDAASADVATANSTAVHHGEQATSTASTE